MERFDRLVRQLMVGVPRRVVAVAPDASVAQALTVMAEADVGAVLVLDHEQLVGVLSERDFARGGELQGRTAQRTRVQELMTREVIYVTPEHTVNQCMALMTGKRIRHLPILEGREVVGVVSIGDLVKSLLSRYEETLRELEHDQLFMRVGETGYY